MLIFSLKQICIFTFRDQSQEVREGTNWTNGRIRNSWYSSQPDLVTVLHCLGHLTIITILSGLNATLALVNCLKVEKVATPCETKFDMRKKENKLYR